MVICGRLTTLTDQTSIFVGPRYYDLREMAVIGGQSVRGVLEREIAKLACSQYGVISRDQALEVGLSESAIKAALRSGRWGPKLRGVYVVAGSPNSWNQDLMAACLFGGESTVASHRSAARLLGLAGFEMVGVLEISSPRNLRRLPDFVLVHKVLRLPLATSL